MKKFISILALAAICFGPGCTNLPTTAYKVAVGSRITVQAALAEWQTYLTGNPGKVSIATQQAIQNDFNKWKQADLAVLDAARAYSSVSSTNNAASALETAFDASIAAANAAAADLINLIHLSMT